MVIIKMIEYLNKLININKILLKNNKELFLILLILWNKEDKKE
jgi:hypothetical protein